MKRDNHQGGVFGFCRVSRHDIAGHEYSEVAVSRIERRAQHAGVCEGACYYEIVHVDRPCC
jgi:hypothetical protein